MLLAFRKVTPFMFLAAMPLALLAIAAVKAVHGDSLGVDFRGELYPEAKLVVNGHNPFPLPDADLSGGVNRIFPVPAALLVSPLTLLPAASAAAVFSLLLLIALAGALRLLGVRDWRVYGMVVLWPPTIAALQTGNLTILLVFLVALAWRVRDRRLTSGLAIGAAVALKIFLWPLLIWLLALRRYSSTAVAGGTAVAGTLLVLPFASLQSYSHLMKNLANTFGGQSYNLRGLLTQSDVASLGVAQLVSLGAGVLMLVLAYKRRSLPLSLAAALILSPIVWLHYFVLLVVPLALVRPRFAAIWALPLVMWECPGSGADVRWWHVVIALTVLLGVTAAAEKVRAVPVQHEQVTPPERQPVLTLVS